jgi:hypothetical protein
VELLAVAVPAHTLRYAIAGAFVPNHVFGFERSQGFTKDYER